MSLRSSFLLALAATGVIAGAQTTFSRPDMRDYDQRRTALPGNGGMYCVPASYTDLFKYMAAYGMPLMDGSYGNSYNDISALMFLTGIGMGTNTDTGTTLDDSWNYASNYIWGNTGYLVYQWGFGPDWDWGINTIRNGVRSGSLVRIGYGRYHFSSTQGFWVRDGGHSVIVSGYDWSSSQKKLVVNDPWSDDGNWGTQGPFTFDVKSTSNITLTMEDYGVQTHARYTNWIGDTGNQRAVVDNMHQIMPIYAGWPTTGRSTEIVTRIPWQFQDTSVAPQPPTEVRHQTVQPPVTWAYDAGQIAFYYADAKGNIYWVDALEGTETKVATIADAAELVVGGTTMDLYVLSRGSVNDKITRLDRDTLKMVSRALPSRAAALDYDAAFGGPALLNSGGTTITTYSEDLSDVRIQTLADPYPNPRALASQLLFKMDHQSGEAILTNEGSQYVTRYSASSGPVRFGRRTDLRGLNSGITELMPADQGILVIQDGSLLKTYDRTGSAVVTQLTNLPTAGKFKMTRSNYAVRAGTTSGPGWANVPPNGIDP